MRLYDEWMAEEMGAEHVGTVKTGSGYFAAARTKVERVLATTAELAEAELKSGLAAHMAATGELPPAMSSSGDNVGGWAEYDPQGESPPAETIDALKSAATSPVAFSPFERLLDGVEPITVMDAEYLRGNPILELIGPGLLTEDK